MPAAPPPHRHYGLDWLRIGAFALLILYHIGMYFSGWRWIVKTADPIGWLAYPMLALTPWRLDLLFVVSGYATFAALRATRRTGPFAKARSRRLLVPLAFAYVVLLPSEVWVRVDANHGYAGTLGQFWLNDYFGIRRIGGVALPSAEHLWFVAYLWAYTMLLCAAVALASPRLIARLRGMLGWLAVGGRLLWAPAAFLVVDRLTLMFVAPDRNGLFTDWAGHALYLPMFLAGYGLAATPALWGAIERLWRPALAAALLGYATVVTIEALYPAEAIPPHLTMMIERAARTLTAWSAILFLLRTADRFWNRDHRLRRPLAAAVFPAYIVHHVAIVMIGWRIAPLGLPHATEFAILAGGTLIACVAAVVAGRRVPGLGPLIGMAGVARSARSARAAPQPGMG